MRVRYAFAPLAQLQTPLALAVCPCLAQRLLRKRTSKSLALCATRGLLEHIALASSAGALGTLAHCPKVRLPELKSDTFSISPECAPARSAAAFVLVLCAQVSHLTFDQLCLPTPIGSYDAPHSQPQALS